MCPNRQVISLYHDGELPSPWKEKMETHLESCPECRAVLTGYGRIGEGLRDEPKNLEAARERVWKRLAASELAASETSAEAQEGSDQRPVGFPVGWKPAVPLRHRNVTLPLPAAAAAILFILASFVFMGIRGVDRTSPQNSIATASIGLDDQGMLPMQDMTGVIQYLSSQDNGDIMVIRLPESRKISRTGEPILINAADYSRRNAYR